MLPQPRFTTDLFEQISGSANLKKDYDEAQTKAEEVIRTHPFDSPPPESFDIVFYIVPTVYHFFSKIVLSTEPAMSFFIAR